jgi:death-on-curing protein
VTQPEFLDVDDVLLIHDGQLARYGGAAGIRDEGLLESALATPKATFGGVFVHEDVFAMAAAYAFHIAENQPFVDGNKRTGVLAAVVFLELNGYFVEEPPSRFYEAMIAIAEHRLDKNGPGALHSRARRGGPPRRSPGTPFLRSDRKSRVASGSGASHHGRTPLRSPNGQDWRWHARALHAHGFQPTARRPIPPG